MIDEDFLKVSVGDEVTIDLREAFPYDSGRLEHWTATVIGFYGHPRAYGVVIDPPIEIDNRGNTFPKVHRSYLVQDPLEKMSYEVTRYYAAARKPMPQFQNDDELRDAYKRLTNP